MKEKYYRSGKTNAPQFHPRDQNHPQTVEL